MVIFHHILNTNPQILNAFNTFVFGATLNALGPIIPATVWLPVPHRFRSAHLRSNK